LAPEETQFREPVHGDPPEGARLVLGPPHRLGAPAGAGGSGSRRSIRHSPTDGPRAVCCRSVRLGVLVFHLGRRHLAPFAGHHGNLLALVGLRASVFLREVNNVIRASCSGPTRRLLRWASLNDYPPRPVNAHAGGGLGCRARLPACGHFWKVGQLPIVRPVTAKETSGQTVHRWPKPWPSTVGQLLANWPTFASPLPPRLRPTKQVRHVVAHGVAPRLPRTLGQAAQDPLIVRRVR
jgi:hypothetical protein